LIKSLGRIQPNDKLALVMDFSARHPGEQGAEYSLHSLDIDGKSMEKDSVQKQDFTTEVSEDDGHIEDSGLEGDQPLSVSEPFPVDPTAPVEVQQFTVRAVLTGCCLGGLIAASNMYLGLKTG
jgi:hypothetical protein